MLDSQNFAQVIKHQNQVIMKMRNEIKNANKVISDANLAAAERNRIWQAEREYLYCSLSNANTFFYMACVCNVALPAFFCTFR